MVGGLFRERFPILESKTYLASHSMGAALDSTEDALSRYFRDWATLGPEAWDGPFWDSVVRFQSLLGGLLGWPPKSICPLQNATRGLAALASSLSYRGPRRRVLIAELEFTTTFPFWEAQADLGAEVVVVPSSDGREMTLEAFEAALDERTLMVVCSHAFFRSGNLCPELSALCQAVHNVGARVVLDAYQTLGAVPLDAAACGVDAVVGGCHKWLCGGPGAGFLAVAPDYWPELRPRLTGWFGLKHPFSYGKNLGRGEPHESALRFLDGTPNIPALYACRPALEMISQIGIETIRSTSVALTEFLRGLLEQNGFQLLSPMDPEARNGMLCLAPPAGCEPKELVARLSEQGILVDYRPDCGLRVSPHFYSTQEDLETFVEALVLRQT